MNNELVKTRLQEIESLLTLNKGEYVDFERFVDCCEDAEDWLKMLSESYRISIPFISATWDGSEVMVDWSKGSSRLYISFYGDHLYHYYFKDGERELFCDNHAFRYEAFDEQIKPLLELFND